MTQRKELLRWSGWFYFFNAGLFWIIGIRYLTIIAPHSAEHISLLGAILVWIYLLVSFIGHMALLAFVPFVCISLPALLIFPQRFFIYFISVIASSLATFLLIADSFIFALYRFHISGFFLQMFLGGAGNEFYDFSQAELYIAGALFIAVIIAEIILVIVTLKYLKKRKKALGRRYAGTISLCLFASYLMFFMAAIATPNNPKKLQDNHALTIKAQTFPLYSNFLAAIMPYGYSIKDIETTGSGFYLQAKQLNGALQYPLHPLQCTAPKHPYNLVMVVIDTWRFDMLNAEVTPHIEAFSKKAWVFSDHMSGGNTTQPGIFSLMYGLPGTYWTGMLSHRQAPVLIHELQQQGYQMGIFRSAPLTAPAFDKTVFSGVKHVRLRTPGDETFQRDRYITKEFKQFLNKATRQNKPFFSFVFFDAAHGYCGAPADGKHPFQPAVKRCIRISLGKDTDPTPYLNRYKNALYFVDGLVGQVISALKHHGLMHNTIIMITGDHGQEFNDNKLGYWGHASNYTHYQVQTPLVLYWPGKGRGFVNAQTTHYDIVPTLMSQMLNCKNPANDYSIGYNLFDPRPTDYLIVSSYMDFGVIEKNRIITILPTGNYLINSPTGKPLGNEKLDLNIMRPAFNDMKRYFRDL